MSTDLPQIAPTSETLAYEVPPETVGPIVEELPSGDVVVDLPPVSTLLFVTMLVPWALSLVLATFMVLALIGAARASFIGAWFIAPLALASSAYWLYALSRYRPVRRVVRVNNRTLSYANAATGGKLVGVQPNRCGRIDVRRCWWRPWTVQIQSRDEGSFWSMRTNLEPVILLIDTDRARLEDIAAILRRALQLQAR